jgi:comEA protein
MTPAGLVPPFSRRDSDQGRFFTRREAMRQMVSSLMALALVAGVVSAHAASGQARPAAASAAASKAAPAAVVNINTASAAELDALPGIGAKVAARIIEYRQKNGPFKKVEELMNVRGVGEKNFLKLKGQITVGAAKADHDRPNE